MPECKDVIPGELACRVAMDVILNALETKNAGGTPALPRPRRCCLQMGLSHKITIMSRYIFRYSNGLVGHSIWGSRRSN
jgi:hypothetical protein